MKTILHTFAKLPYCIILLLISALQLNNTAFAQAPINDNCVGAVNLTPGAPGAACSGGVTGTLVNATNSGIAAAPCGGNPTHDVWYKFTSTSTDHTVTVSGIGSNLSGSAGGGARIQLFSGTCGALTSMACAAQSGSTATFTVTTLARGTVYYVRVYSTNNTVLPNNAGFTICVTTPAVTPQIDFGKSYVNISKPNSGTVETGDTLEIRASIAVRSGSYDSCQFKDNVPAGTSYIPGTLRVLTNEGKIFRQFTDAFTDTSNDQGWLAGSAITINLGYNSADWPASIYRRGRIRNNNGHKPSFYGSSCIMMASYRVKVTSAIGSTINTGGGSMTYTLAPPAISTFTFPSNPVAVYTNYGVCANATGANSLGTEFNGTFGSGPKRNRGTSANVPTGYTYDIFTANGPNDYFYGIANNTSTVNNYTTLNTWAKPDGSSPTHRVFGVWDIIGDHTGATNTALGNPATDTVANHNGGYMLVVNAAFRIDSAFQQTISNLCPNTYYEISAWMRNICSKCGCDSNGKGSADASGPVFYIPTAPGDSSGVYPNITFEVDGVDYYSTGNITYTGKWVKKGFTILTGPSQNSFTLKFFNNAPGGGGNDWALDDISVATCLPVMKYSPSVTPSVCKGNALTISDTVRSFFDNYVYYKWQRSTDGGVTWTDVTTVAGPVTATWNGTAYEYVSSYTIPPGSATLANSGDKYRLVVATTPTNITSAACSTTDVSNIVTITVINCGPPLNTTFTTLTGKLNNDNKATLNWITGTENGPLYYDIEKSYNGTNFNVIGTVNGHDDPAAEQNNYVFNDPVEVVGKVYYRITSRTTDNIASYSRTLLLSSNIESFSFASVVNPFANQLYFDISSAKDGIAKAELVDQFGIVIKNKSVDIKTGINQLTFDNTAILAPGIYVLRVTMNEQVIYRKVVKQNR